MLPSDAEATNLPPVWQTSWTSDFLAEERFEKYAAKVNGKLIALAAYEVLQNSLVVHIVYMEAHPESNPTLDDGQPEYTGIGRLLIAYGIKLSIDNGFAGDVVLEAKTTGLAKHYEKDFGAVKKAMIKLLHTRHFMRCLLGLANLLRLIFHSFQKKYIKI